MIKIILFLVALTLDSFTPSFAESVVVKDGNIFWSGEKGDVFQVTSDGSYEEPVISVDNKFVLFVRQLELPNISEIWKFTFKDKQLKRIFPTEEEKRQFGGHMGQIRALQLTADSRTTLFLAGWWETSDRVFKLKLDSGKLIPLVPGNKLKIQPDGNLVINQHRYHNGGGSYDCDYLFSPIGKELKSLGNCE